MHLLEALAMAFFNTFGITHPTEAGLRRAAWYVLGLMAFTMLVVSAVGYGFYYAMHR